MNVLENILKQIDELKENYWCDSKERKDGAMDMSNIIKDIIKQHLQSGEDNNVLADDWIPVEEGLPKKGETVLCYFKYDPESPDVMCDNTYLGSGMWQSETEKVVAWMKRPREYKPAPESADGKRQREREEFFSEYK